LLLGLGLISLLLDFQLGHLFVLLDLLVNL
jgi:hypothetical protein